ncbi:MAG: hypothetical protein AB8G05_07755 [Oligoflexales bacterium]
MKIRCISNKGTGLTSRYICVEGGYHSGTSFKGLTFGKEYNVYAVGFRNNEAWFYICDDNFIDSPRKYPECLFEEVDKSLASDWTWSHYEDNEDQTYFLAPSFWGEDEYFFEKLIDSDENAVAKFFQFKEIVDSE